jgi:hypothetical protein
MRRSRDFSLKSEKKVVSNFGFVHFLMNLAAAVFIASAIILCGRSLLQDNLLCNENSLEFFNKEEIKDYCWSTISYEKGCEGNHY